MDPPVKPEDDDLFRIVTHQHLRRHLRAPVTSSSGAGYVILGLDPRIQQNISQTASGSSGQAGG